VRSWPVKVYGKLTGASGVHPTSSTPCGVFDSSPCCSCLPVSSSSGPSDPQELNLLLNNQAWRRVTVELTIGGTVKPGISINNGAFVTVLAPATAGFPLNIECLGTES